MYKRQTQRGPRGIGQNLNAFILAFGDQTDAAKARFKLKSVASPEHMRESTFGAEMKKTEASKRVMEKQRESLVSCCDRWKDRFCGSHIVSVSVTHPANQNAEKPWGQRFLNRLRRRVLADVTIVSLTGYLDAYNLGCARIEPAWNSIVHVAFPGNMRRQKRRFAQVDKTPLRFNGWKSVSSLELLPRPEPLPTL